MAGKGGRMSKKHFGADEKRVVCRKRPKVAGAPPTPEELEKMKQEYLANGGKVSK